MIKKMLGFSLGVLYANAFEWAAHKYVLHGLGKGKGTFFAFHWHEHHRNARRNEHIDPTYTRPLVGWHAQGKEALALLGTALLHWPVVKRAPWFGMALGGSLVAYYLTHKRSHLDAQWAREHLPWHYDHHMGPDQDANWCVTFPLFDHLMGTRKPYAGTARERADQDKRARLQARRATARPDEGAQEP